jgi:hypothetical protein
MWTLWHSRSVYIKVVATEVASVTVTSDVTVATEITEDVYIPVI